MAMLAIRMLAPGPAAATATMPQRGERSLVKLTGTGLAQPNRKLPITISMAGRMMVPNGSTWRSGLSEMRPSRRAVSSPMAQAT